MYVHKYEKNESMKKRLGDQCREYMTRAEAVKKLLKSRSEPMEEPPAPETSANVQLINDRMRQIVFCG